MRSFTSGFLNSSLQSLLCCFSPAILFWIIQDFGAAGGTGQGQHAPPPPPPTLTAQPPGLHLSALSSPHHPLFSPLLALICRTDRCFSKLQPFFLPPPPHPTPPPRSSPRPVFIRVALTTHSSVGLIHHHHEERVRGVGTKTRGGKVMHKSQKSGVWIRRKLLGETNGERTAGKEAGTPEGEDGGAASSLTSISQLVSERVIPQRSSFPAKVAACFLPRKFPGGGAPAAGSTETPPKPSERGVPADLCVGPSVTGCLGVSVPTVRV